LSDASFHTLELPFLDDATPQSSGSEVPERRIDPDGWSEIVAPVGYPQIVVGGPGTGKTQFLARRIAAAIEEGTSPEDVVVLAFSRAGAADIRHRLADLVGPAAVRCRVGTYHAIARQLVESHAAALGWSAPPTILTGVEQERLVAELLAEEDPGLWPSMLRPLVASSVMAGEMTDFILRSSEQRLDTDAVRSLGRPIWQRIPAFLERYDAALRDTNRIDYGRLLMQATSLVEEQDERSKTLGLVAADEYQDTSPVQREFLLALARHGADLTVAADPYQSIYSFRGSDVDNVFSFPDDVHRALGTAAERIILTTSFRVPAEILDAAVAVTARELPGGAGKVRSVRSAGSVSCHEFPTTGIEAEWIAADIERMHLVDDIALDRIAVFVRTSTGFVDELARALDRRSIDHSHTDERLSDEPIVRFIHDLVRATARAGADDGEGEAALRRVLLGPVIGLPHGLVARMPETPDDRTAWVSGLPGCRPLARLIEDATWATADDAARGLWRVWSTLPQAATIAIAPERAHERRAWSAYAQVVDRIGERAPGTTLLDMVDVATRFDFEANTLYSFDETEGVTLGTLHRAKGTEFDVVYIADAVEGQLPDLRHRDSLLGVRFLNPNLPTDTADYVTFRLDEERRLAYTAMTRSTTRVVWTATTASDSGTGRAPSRFMRLVAPSTTPLLDDRPLTPRSLLASLRRTLSDPLAPVVDRLASVQFLAGHRGPDFDAMEGYGVGKRGEDRGVVPQDLRLSPSRAVRYSTCPRAFAIEHYVVTRTDESVYMRFGTLIHAVVEATEREALSGGHARGNADRAIEHLAELWGDLGLGEDTVGTAWRTRAETMLTTLYERWPSSGTAVELEVDLPLELAGVPWLGRADRIEREGRSITVVDYKTGSAPTAAEAASSLQLGFYILAARSDPEITSHGAIDAASFWHPKHTAHGKVATRHFDPANLDDVTDELIAIAESIKAEVFDPKPGSHCRTCPFATVCPAQPAGVEAFLP
jgi:superfamily I DNA/RNA helicase/RecB family exonuclease